MFIYLNANPSDIHTGDCVIRAIMTLEQQSWEKTMLELTAYSYFMHRIIDDNYVWETYLKDKGYRHIELLDTCPDCYTLRDFCELHPIGKYIVCTGSHVVAVMNGNYYDTWNSGNEIVRYYFRKGFNNG